MMDRNDRFFTPEQVDEQIEESLSPWPRGTDAPEARLLAEMQQVARQLRAEQERSLQRTWARLRERSIRGADSFPRQRSDQQMQDEEAISFPQRSKQIERRTPQRLGRVLSIVATAAVVLLIVLAWAVLAPVLHSHMGLAGGPTTAKKTPLATQAATLRNAKQVCSFTDTNAAAASFFINYSLDWSKSGSLALTHRNSVVVNGADCTRDSHYQNKLSIPEGAVWSPDGKRLLAFTNIMANGLGYTELQTVNARGQVQSTIVLQSGGPVGSIAPGGGLFSSRVQLSANKSATWGPAWSPDGSEFSAIFSPGGGYHLMTWKTQGQQQVLDKPLTISAPITDVAWSPDGQYVAVATNNPAVGVEVYNAHTGALVKHLATKVLGSTVTNVAWSPDGQELATASDDNQVRLWQVATGALIRQLTGGQSVTTIGTDFQIAWSPDGKELAAGDQRTVVWEVASGKVVATIPHDNRIVVALAWGPDSQRLATLSTLGALENQTKATLTVWDLSH